jgi:DNA-binding HxlR family transcriptional regulator
MPTMTAAQRREQERAAYNAYVASCPSRQMLDALSDKWVTLVLTALADGTRRYSELARTIAGVIQKMLTQTLRALERDGLITRTVTASVPVRVDYELTPLGQSILPVVRAIKDWAETHIEQVHAARAAYDQGASPDGLDRRPGEQRGSPGRDLNR